MPRLAKQRVRLTTVEGGRVMANRQKSELTIDLDRPRTFKLDFNALCEAEGVIGRSVLRQDLGLSEIRALLWAGLKHEDKTLTVQKVGTLLTADKLTKVMTLVGDAVSEFFAVGEEVGAGDTPTG